MRTGLFLFLVFLLLVDYLSATERGQPQKIISTKRKTEETIKEGAPLSTKGRSNSLTGNNLVMKDSSLLFDFNESMFQVSEVIDSIPVIAEIIANKKYGLLANIDVEPSTVQQLCTPKTLYGLEGFTLMHMAAYCDHDEAILWLAARGCSTNVYISRGYTPLQIACSRDCVKAAKALISIPKTDPYAFSANGRSAIMSAVLQGDLELVNAFLEQPHYDLKRLLGARGSLGKSILELAHIGSPKVNPSQKSTSDAALVYAGAHDALINRLLEFSSSIVPDSDFLVRLFINDRIRFDRVAIVMPKCAVTALKMLNVNLLKVAIIEEKIALIRSIHAAGVMDPLQSFDEHGLLPIHFAAYHNRLEIVLFYLNDLAIPAEIKSKSDHTASEFARMEGHVGLADILELSEGLKEAFF